MTLFPLIWDESKGGRRRERQEKQKLMNRDGVNEQSLSETALMIPHLVSQCQIKTTSTQKQSRSPKLQNNLIGSTVCYCTRVWVVKFTCYAVIYPLLNNAPSRFSFCIHYCMFEIRINSLDIDFVLIPIGQLLKLKQVDKCFQWIIRSFRAVSVSLWRMSAG